MIKDFIKEIKFRDVLPYIVFIILMIIALAMKFDYHVDETLTYALSNNAEPIYYMTPQEGVRYENSMDPYTEYLSVKPGNSFSYAIPYYKQVYESHPPIYYALVHTVSSFFPGTFSRWYAGTVNILFALGILFVLRRMVEILTGNYRIKEYLTWGFVFCYAILSEVTFFRMYVVTMFLTTLTTLIFLWQIQKDRGIWFYVFASFAVFVGSLTYYGTLIFSLMICTTYGVYLLINKKWKDVAKFVDGMALAGIAAVVVFPAIIGHIFGAGRGEEAIGNMLNISDFLSRLGTYSAFYNDFVFGRIMPLIVLALIGLLVYAKKTGKLEMNKQKMMYYVMIIIPSILYFLLASKSAPYPEERYTSLAYVNAYVGILCPLMILLHKLFSKKIATIVSVCLIVLISSIGLFTNRWQYLYRWEMPKFEPLNEYKDYDCVCVHSGENWRLNTYIIELTHYKGLTFIDLDDLDNYNLEDFIKTGNGVVVLAGIMDDSVMEAVMKQLPNYSGYEYISERSFYVYK